MKKNWWTIITIFGVIILAILIINRSSNNADEKIAKCIGEHSVVYVQLGCHACETQEKMFGKNKRYLNKIDCFYEREKCENITGTPTWVINGTQYLGVQSIEKLKELTGC